MVDIRIILQGLSHVSSDPRCCCFLLFLLTVRLPRFVLFAQTPVVFVQTRDTAGVWRANNMLGRVRPAWRAGAV